MRGVKCMKNKLTKSKKKRLDLFSYLKAQSFKGELTVESQIIKDWVEATGFVGSLGHLLSYLAKDNLIEKVLNKNGNQATKNRKKLFWVNIKDFRNIDENVTQSAQDRNYEIGIMASDDYLEKEFVEAQSDEAVIYILKSAREYFMAEAGSEYVENYEKEIIENRLKLTSMNFFELLELERLYKEEEEEIFKRDSELIKKAIEFNKKETVEEYLLRISENNEDIIPF